MSKEIEIEVKVLLNYKTYMRVFRYFNFEKAIAIAQNNYYFDTPDFQLNKIKAALRIRNIGNNYTLTLKTMLPEGRLEINEEISKALFDSLLEGDYLKKGEVYDKLIELGINTKTLKYFNSLTTKRYLLNHAGGKLCLDYNTYGDYADYELEFEGSSLEQAKKTIQNLLDDIGIPFAFTDLSKIERVINATIKN